MKVGQPALRRAILITVVLIRSVLSLWPWTLPVFDVEDLGSGNLVTLTVTDADNNSATGTAIVTVEDNLAPTAIAQDLTISMEGGIVTLTPEQVDNGSRDNTGIITLSLDQTSFSAEGDYTVTLTVTDAAGNSSRATATIRVEENIPPVAVTQDITIELDENGTVYDYPRGGGWGQYGQSWDCIQQP